MYKGCFKIFKNFRWWFWYENYNKVVVFSFSGYIFGLRLSKLLIIKLLKCINCLF